MTPWAAAAYAETDATLAGEYAARQEELERQYAAEKLLTEALENRVASLNASLVAEQVMSKVQLVKCSKSNVAQTRRGEMLLALALCNTSF